MDWVKSLTQKKDHKILWKEINTSIVTKNKKKLDIDSFSGLLRNYKLKSLKFYLI